VFFQSLKHYKKEKFYDSGCKNRVEEAFVSVLRVLTYRGRGEFMKALTIFTDDSRQ